MVNGEWELPPKPPHSPFTIHDSPFTRYLYRSINAFSALLPGHSVS